MVASLNRGANSFKSFEKRQKRAKGNIYTRSGGGLTPLNFQGKLGNVEGTQTVLPGKGFIQQEIVNFTVPSCLLILRCTSPPQSISCYGDTSVGEAYFKLSPKSFESLVSNNMKPFFVFLFFFLAPHHLTFCPFPARKLLTVTDKHLISLSFSPYTWFALILY